MSVEKLLAKFDSIDKINLELKRVQSVKCRIKKLRSKPGTQDELKKVLLYEDELKQARNALKPKAVSVPDMTKNDISQLDYDQTIRALRSIQSKKTLTKYIGEVPEQNEEYKKACEVEQMLKEHRETLAPIDEKSVRKTEIQAIVEALQTTDLNQDQIADMLKKLI